jgi:hypothetical protein
MSQSAPKPKPAEPPPVFGPAPQREHQWLQQLVGEWSYETATTVEPGQPPVTAQGTESVRSLGGLWVLGESQGEMPGGAIGTALVTLGYDITRKRFVGTWIGSMMTNLWVYDGELDASGRVLTLDSEGPSMSDDGTTSKYQDVIAFQGDNQRTMTSRTLLPDGTWQQFMTVVYRRAK